MCFKNIVISKKETNIQPNTAISTFLVSTQCRMQFFIALVLICYFSSIFFLFEQTEYYHFNVNFKGISLNFSASQYLEFGINSTFFMWPEDNLLEPFKILNVFFKANKLFSVVERE